MQACLDVTLPYVHQRKQFGIPIGQNQLVQAKLANMHVKLSAARAYTMAAAKAVDEGTIETRDCAGAILFASDRSVECALDTIQCLGGTGYVNEIPAGRLLRDAKVGSLPVNSQYMSIYSHLPVVHNRGRFNGSPANRYRPQFQQRIPELRRLGSVVGVYIYICEFIIHLQAHVLFRRGSERGIEYTYFKIAQNIFGLPTNTMNAPREAFFAFSVGGPK